MSWTSVAMESVCDIADPGWTRAEAPEAACDLAASEALYGMEEDTLLDTGYEGGSSGWTTVRMESPCDG